MPTYREDMHFLFQKGNQSQMATDTSWGSNWHGVAHDKYSQGSMIRL